MEMTNAELHAEILRMKADIATLKGRTDHGLASPNAARRIFTATVYVLVGYITLSLLLGFGLLVMSIVASQ